MYLLLLIIIFVCIGYLVASSRIGDKVDETAEKVTRSSKDWTTRTKDWWTLRLGGRKKASTFCDWATSVESKEFPNEFKDWLISLSDEDSQAFSQALSEHADSLGFNLALLVQGGYAHQPLLKQVFVETIVVYSDAYRKAKQAQKEAKEIDEEQDAPDNEKQPQGKQNGHERLKETPETAPAV